MEDYLKQIEQALNYNLYYIALQSTLTLPDICGALQSETGEASKSKYLTWFNNYFKGNTSLNALDCYYFRCANVHQAKTIHKDLTYSRILFFEPCTTTNSFHNCILDDALLIDVNIFCREMILSAYEWLTLMKNNTNFNNNFKSFIQRRPNGIPPYVVGAPVIS